MFEKFEYNMPIRMTLQEKDKILVGYHYHKNFEFIRILKGKVLVRLDGDSFTAKAGQVIFVPSRQMHGVESLSEDARLIGLVVERKYITSLIEGYDTKQLLDSLLESKHLNHMYDEKMGELLSKSVDLMYEAYLDKPPLYELKLKEVLFRMLRALYLEHEQELIDEINLEKDIALLEPVLHYMQLHAHEKIKVEELSDLASMSSSHFSRYFKKCMKKTPMEYLLDIRMQVAMKRLRESDDAITVIAIDLGYDTGYFTKTFKKYTGQTPRDYRRSSSI